MLISPATAQQILADLTGSSAVPAACEGLSRYWFQENNHVMIGEVAVRGYKHKGAWRVDDRDIRRAAHALAQLDLRPERTVPVTLPRQRRREVSLLHDWRARLLDWIEQAQDLHQHNHSCGCSDFVCRKPLNERIAVEDLTDPLLLEALLARPRPPALAGTRPFPLLSWSGTNWLLPDAYAAMLTRAETTASDLTVNAAACTRCGVHGDWPRSSTSSGFVTLCPACAQAVYQVYSGHLAGVFYASLSPRTRADAYLCCLCTQPRRAYYWDHCHEPGHGKVRGPVCAGCNTLEGGGWHYLQHPEAVPHLLRCTDCRRKNTLPARHRATLVRDLHGAFPVIVDTGCHAAVASVVDRCS
ncbi:MULTISPECIES: endonuclease domain-containing protein [unclassified Streptomyces]|uniref:endonuclease domain-containing protein n=1 Tax=unclassified Streptomyces TaxID=2593676 RepID=UPI002255A226|nr:MULTISPECIES: endonuclease domain-containing protein [unclassified Streptomyces]MCX4650226.1 endonuclease VII domain-containing protein [Streptomyces sp. NBC_01446]MCX5327777.1 endonuclease VII domain-containing protein [Streptomyces sp. NBC_00120]